MAAQTQDRGICRMTSHVVSDDELGWHEAEVAGRPRTSICSMVSAHAASRPDRPAVIDPDGRHLTYRELQRRSGGLAVQLAADGVGPGSCVGVFLERSSEFVVAAYAVLRAGAAYLPLDVATPQDRLEFVLSDADVAAVVTRTAGELPGRPVAHASGSTSRSPSADAAIPAWTTGSGRPRLRDLHLGQHGSPQGCRAHPREPGAISSTGTSSAFGVTPADRASQVASLGFDAAVWEIWPAPRRRARRVHFADEATRRSPQLLRDWLVAEKITIALRADGAGRAADPPRLAGRDGAAHPAHRRRRRCTAARRPGCRSRWSTTTGRPSARSSPPRARSRRAPTPTTPRRSGGRSPTPTAWSWTTRCSRSPPGEAGRAVPRRRAGRPRLPQRSRADREPVRHAAPRLRAAAAGVPHGRPVRLLDDGEIAFLGRLDEQVKIRGFRIEPARSSPRSTATRGVAASAVVGPRRAPDGEPELVAYVVPADGASALPPRSCATFLAAAAARLHGPGHVRRARRPAADAQRQARRGARCPAPAAGATSLPGRRDPRRRTAALGRRRRSAGWWRRCWSCPRRRRRTTSSCSAATRCSRCSWSRAIQQAFGVEADRCGSCSTSRPVEPGSSAAVERADARGRGRRREHDVHRATVGPARREPR